jgi:hypothetical protein
MLECTFLIHIFSRDLRQSGLSVRACPLPRITSQCTVRCSLSRPGFYLEGTQESALPPSLKIQRIGVSSPGKLKGNCAWDNRLVSISSSDCHCTDKDENPPQISALRRAWQLGFLTLPYRYRRCHPRLPSSISCGDQPVTWLLLRAGPCWR